MVTLIVNDGLVDSAVSTVTVTATAAPAPSLTLKSVPDSWGCFFSCSETVLTWPYSMSSSASASVTCMGSGCSSYYDVATFKLTASGQSFTITNLQASGSMTPWFSGLSNGQTIISGQTVTFKLQSPFTRGATVYQTYSFTVKETGQTFRYTVSLTTN